MGIMDKLGDAARNNPDKVDDAIDKGGDMIDQRTDNKYADHVDKGQDFAKDKFGSKNQDNK